MPALILGLILLVVLAIAAAVLLRPLAQIRRIRRLATVPIGMLPLDGPAEVTGSAGGVELRSPLAGALCVLWQVEVQEYRSSGKSGHWVTVFARASDEPFEIDDGTGHVRVLPAGAQLTLEDDVRQSRGLLQRLSPEIEVALERLGVPLHGFLGLRRTLRVRERYVAPGEQVFALGYVEHIGERPALRSIPDAPLILADRSEQALLGGLYRRVGTGVLLMLIALGAGGWLLVRIGGWP